MNKITRNILIIALIIVGSIMLVACDKGTLDTDSVVGRYDMPFTEGYEYQYLELCSDGSWTMAYKEVGEDEVSVSGTYAIDEGDVIFSGESLPSDIDFTIENDTARITYDGATYEESPTESDPTIIAPVVTLDGSTVSWTAIEGATGYLVYEGASVVSSQNTINYEIGDGYVSGVDYAFTVITCKGVLKSNASNTVVYSISLPQLASPSNFFADYDGCHLSWSAVPNAIGYYVYEGNDFRYSTEADDDYSTQYPYYDLSGVHVFSVIAVGDNENYSNSEASPYTVTVIDGTMDGSTYATAPTISIDGDTIVWDAIAGVDNYDLYLNKFHYQSNVTSGFTPDMLIQGFYTLSVRVTRDSNYLDSPLSNEVNYYQATSSDKLSSPTISADDQGSYGVYLDWNEIVGADSYTIMEGDTELDSTELLTYNLKDVTDVSFTPNSIHSITVIATSEYSSIGDSLPSNAISYTVPQIDPLPTPSNLTYNMFSDDVYLNCDYDFNVTNYKIYIDAVYETTISTDSFENSTVLIEEGTISFELPHDFAAGTYDISIIAVDEYGCYLDSAMSDSIEISIYL